jgi:hypothetical protein
MYNPNIPESPSASIGKDQLNFLNNFSALYNSFGANHVVLDATSGAGNHSVIELIPQSSPIQTDGGEISIYSKAIEGQADQIMLRYEKNQDEFQLTAYQIYALKSSLTQTPYFTFLPGNVLMYFGTISGRFRGGNPTILPLKPEVAKNIIGMNFCRIGAADSDNFQPMVSLPTPQNGIYPFVNMYINRRGGADTFSFFYMVLANI